MRVITPEPFTVYKFEELSEQAQQRAIESIVEMLQQSWDSRDIEQVGEVILYTFAQKLGTPGLEEWGFGDFPGIPGTTLAEWDLDRSQTVKFQGVLTRENAPSLPWANGITSVILNDRNYQKKIHVSWDYYAAGEPDDAAVQAMSDAVGAALVDAWDSGNQEAEYRTSEEFAVEWINDAEPEFREDGTLYT